MKLEAERVFRPEFLNRLDEIVVFKSLSQDNASDIVRLEVEKVTGRLKEENLTVILDEKAYRFLEKEGFNARLGARPLKRVIQRLILDPLSIKIVTNEISEGSRILIDEKAGKIIFESPKVMPKMQERPKLAKVKK